MATAAEILESGCDTEITKVNNPVTLLQIIAQTSADAALAANPALDISVEAIKTRACTSGIGQENNQVELLQIIAQLLNDL